MEHSVSFPDLYLSPGMGTRLNLNMLLLAYYKAVGLYHIVRGGGGGEKKSGEEASKPYKIGDSCKNDMCIAYVSLFVNMTCVAMAGISPLVDVQTCPTTSDP